MSLGAAAPIFWNPYAAAGPPPVGGFTAAPQTFSSATDAGQLASLQQAAVESGVGGAAKTAWAGGGPGPMTG